MSQKSGETSPLSSPRVESKKGSMLSFLYEAEEDINYNFILGAYIVCSIICALLFVCDHLNLLEAIKGYWIVFSPFPVMLPWAFFMRRQSISKFGKEKKE